MIEITDRQLAVLFLAYRGEHRFLPQEVAGLDDAGLVVPEDVPDGNLWDLTSEGSYYVESKGRELCKPDFGDLSAAEKKIIVWQGPFPEADRRRLLFDPDGDVAYEAIRKFDLTEEEFIRLGAHPSPTVRCDVLRIHSAHLCDGKDLDRKLSRYLRNDDLKTVEAILETLRVTENTDFVGEDLIARWFRSDIPREDLVRMFCRNGVEVPDSTIASLFAERTSWLLGVICTFMLDRLDPGQIDIMLDESDPVTREEVARRRMNLTASQVERLANDGSASVRNTLLRRLGPLAKGLKMVEDNPELIDEIRNGSIPEPAAR